MKRFRDYFQDKIDKEPSWMGTIRKKKKIHADLEGDAEEESGNTDHQPTEKLEEKIQTVYK